MILGDFGGSSLPACPPCCALASGLDGTYVELGTYLVAPVSFVSLAFLSFSDSACGACLWPCKGSLRPRVCPVAAAPFAPLSFAFENACENGSSSVPSRAVSRIVDGRFRLCQNSRTLYVPLSLLGAVAAWAPSPSASSLPVPRCPGAKRRSYPCVFGLAAVGRSAGFSPPTSSKGSGHAVVLTICTGSWREYDILGGLTVPGLAVRLACVPGAASVATVAGLLKTASPAVLPLLWDVVAPPPCVMAPPPWRGREHKQHPAQCQWHHHQHHRQQQKQKQQKQKQQKQQQ
eukprot:scpid43691/ scgid31767/ 